MKPFIMLLIVCFVCNSCFADEAPEISTGEKLKPLIQKGLEQKDGYDLPGRVAQTIKIRTAQLKELKAQFDKLKIQSELIRSKMELIDQDTTSEVYIFLASMGVPRVDMGSWQVDGDKVKRVGK